ncbi:phage tail tape measure protein [Neoaquamicrobium sediminum]|uniref:phage tail tape measure protein n=1 Tax=Neoaquamicrobium sediminum TaxID=1849104 RepID=UPI003BAA90DB
MNDSLEPLEIQFEMDTRPFADAMRELADLSDAFGRQLTGALRDAAINGRSLEDVLQRIGMNLAGMALSQGLKPLSGLISDLLPRLIGGFPFVTEAGSMRTPEFFPDVETMSIETSIPPSSSAASAGIETGHIAPRAGSPVNVVFNVTTQDAASFRKSEAQITGMLARAVSRGARTL